MKRGKSDFYRWRRQIGHRFLIRNWRTQIRRARISSARGRVVDNLIMEVIVDSFKSRSRPEKVGGVNR